jgi:hypothetical protein
VTVIPGLFQTPDYARHVLIQNADLMDSPREPPHESPSS